MAQLSFEGKDEVGRAAIVTKLSVSHKYLYMSI